MSRPRAAVLVLALASCSRAPAPAHTHASASKAQPAHARALAPDAEREGRAPLPPLDADGCAADFVGSTNAEASLTELARLCAAGMRPLSPRRAGAVLRAGERGAFDFEVRDATRCVRALAAFEPTLREIELELVDAAGRASARVARERSFALIGENGPVCLAAAGRYRVTVQARHGQGVAVVELYQVDE